MPNKPGPKPERLRILGQGTPEETAEDALRLALGVKPKKHIGYSVIKDGKVVEHGVHKGLVGEK